MSRSADARPDVKVTHPGAWVLRLLTAGALGASAYLHLALAQGPLAGGGQVTVAGLFLAQAVVAMLVALAVLLRPSRAVWVLAAVVALGSLAALLLSVYVRIPAMGPFPALYEPSWYPDKVFAAGAAALATITALGGLLAGRR